MGDDPDRAAILGRRNRLIALALSGIGAAAGCGDPAPCLSVQPVEPPALEEHEHTGPMVPDEPVVHPTPCLAPPQPPDEESTPDEPADETAAEEPPPEPRRPRPRTTPHPCLSAPRDIPPCLTPLYKKG